MKFRASVLFVFLLIAAFSAGSFAQDLSVIGQITSSVEETFAGGISGDGRFVVFESRGNIATENPRNADNNLEIFLFDYAQRRVFQITDTKSVLFDTSGTGIFSNVRVAILNTRPVISNDGRYIAFSSNATIAFPGDPTANPPVPPVVSSTNPGSFDGNAYTSPTPTPSPSPSPTASPAPNPLTKDGNLEIWIYTVPSVPPASNLSSGDEIPYAELAGGTFTRVTNTLPSQLPRAGTNSTGAFIADDNHDATISSDGSTIGFISTRDLVPSVGNSFPANEDNDEVFIYKRLTDTITQVTKTPRGVVSDPIYNKNPTISGDGTRICFASTGDDPIDDPASATNFDTGSNPASSRNEEIFFANLSASGLPTGGKQITTTTPSTPGTPVNILDLGKRMSKDGRFIAFDSYADLANENSGANYTTFATYVYDATVVAPNNPFRRVLPRSDADSNASGGDIQRYPTFTDYDGSGTPATLMMQTRMNIKADGTIAATNNDGLNPNSVRPSQLYRYPLTIAPAAATFTRIAKFPTPNTFLASTQAITSDSSRRFVFNLALSELGGENLDSGSEAFYMLTPPVTSQISSTVNVFTGASRQPVSPTVVPTPTPTPTPSPTPTPTGSPSPTPTPTPATPPAVFGVAPGMLATLNYPPLGRAVTPKTGVGSLKRSFTLPIELSGVTMTINGYACGLKAVGLQSIDFVVPPGLIANDVAGTKYPLVINNNGAVLTTEITLVPARPDIFRADGIAGPGGRVKAFNVTNRVFTTEPFTVRTIRTRPLPTTFIRRVPSQIRIYLTGVRPAVLSGLTVRAGNSSNALLPIVIAPVLVEPGVYTLDVTLRDELNMAGDVPIVVTFTSGTTTFDSRLDDTAPRIRIL